MNSPLKPHQILSHWIPGLVVLLILVISRFDWDYVQFTAAFASQGSIASVSVIILAVAAFLLGEFLDCLRDGICEWVWDYISNNRLNWDILFIGTSEMQLKRDIYWTYYVLCHNVVLGLLICLILNMSSVILLPARMPTVGIVWIWIFAIAFAWNAFTLRKEMCSFTNKESEKKGEEMSRIETVCRPPHFGVLTRIRPSSIHGVGVFAIRDIPEGTYLFSEDNSKVVWVDKSEFTFESEEVRLLYKDFCIIKKDKYGCPDNFNNLNVGWYLNESKDGPNVRCNDEYDFYALRDLKKDEELTVDYSTFSDEP